ncbi:MAG: hypothetical protein FJ395_03715 [Verrucomicrobia bacterium]|nr:hypothetical protein [Verrucomicrobiota bacterium]
MFRLKAGPRFEYRAKEKQRVKDSPLLAEKFRQLKSLTLDLAYYDATRATKHAQIKYVPNLNTAKAVFLVDCPNHECIGGDFELTGEIAGAIAKHRASASGELICQGWLSKTTINTVPCHNVLHYKLSFDYQSNNGQ